MGRNVKGRLPASAYVRIESERVSFDIDIDIDVYVVSPEMCAAQMATIPPAPLLIKALYQLCGTYGECAESHDVTENKLPATSVADIRHFAERNRKLRSTSKVLSALKYVADGSASPRETSTAMMLSLPGLLGGFGLPVPVLNRRIAI